MKYKVNAENANWRVVDGKAVVVSLESSYYYGLNRTGTFIWTLLCDEACSAADLAARLAGTFDIDAVRAQADVDAVLNDLRRENLIVEN